MNRDRLKLLVFVHVSAAALLAASQGFAQTQPQGDAVGLEEIIVTATRQADTVNRVPLSVAAVTQQTLDQQGVKSAADITRLVPGLNIAQPGTSVGVGQFSIRGIVGGAGAATTGVYLDDTSLTKRANNGTQQNNGAPLPILFDLERVEVLKGPQGTLYGGSSQGGTIRFVTPEPSLTTFSGNARVEGRTIKMGEQGYEAGVALGGPLVQGKLGFRVSAMARTSPGWIDGYNAYTGQLVDKNVNQIDDTALRGALKWQATDRLSFTATGYRSTTKSESQISSPTTVYSARANGQVAAPGETFSTPQTCINTQSRTAGQPILAYNPALPINSAPGATPIVPGNCTPSTPLSAQFIRAAQTYGPFDYLGRDDNLMTTQLDLKPAKTRLNVFSLTANYDFEHMNVKSITSYIDDETHHESSQGTEDPTQRQSLVGLPASVRGFPLFRPFPDYAGHFVAFSKRYGIEQELRFSSPADQRPLTWVAGLFYSQQDIHQLYAVTDRGLAATQALFWGVTIPQRYGLTQTGPFSGFLEADLKDNEVAAFAELNYWIADKLKVTGGLRASRVSFDFAQSSYGVNSSRYPNSAGSFVSGHVVNSPVTPKIGLTYEFTRDDLVYVNAAKGFRAGGVNAPIGQTICEVGLNQFGITANDIPPSYGPDNVWSYEAGGKFRLLENRLQLNGAVYRIDWTGIQSTFTVPGCNQTFVQNGAKARSEGVDLQAQYRPLHPLTLTVNVGYTNARYLDAVAGPRGLVPGVPPSINKGDNFAVPKWQVSASATYDFMLAGLDMYARADYQWQSQFTGPGTFGVATYNPFTLKTPARDQLNARVGARFDSFDVNVFAFNLLDGEDRIGNSGVGISGCPASSPTCTGFVTFNPFVNQAYQRPREIGVQVNYRF